MVMGVEKLEEQFFPVAEKPYLKRTPYGDIVESSIQKMVYRSDTGEELGGVSKEFAVLPHQQAWELLQAAIEDTGVDAIIDRAWTTSKGVNLQYDIRFPSRSIMFRGQEIQYRHTVGNGLTGDMRFRFQEGAFELVCSNGMYIGYKAINFSTKHVGHILDRIDNLSHVIRGSLETGPEHIQKEVDTYHKKKLPERLVMVGEAAVRVLKAEDRRDLYGEALVRSGDEVRIDNPTFVLNELVWQMFDTSSIANKYIEQIAARARKYRPDTYWELYRECTNVMTHQPSSAQVSYTGLRQLSPRLKDAMGRTRDGVLVRTR